MTWPKIRMAARLMTAASFVLLMIIVVLLMIIITLWIVMSSVWPEWPVAAGLITVGCLATGAFRHRRGG
jgi:hypothetical protein